MKTTNMALSKVIVYKYGKPAKGIKVSLEFWSGFSKSFYTNSDGIGLIEHSTTGTATIYADGKKRHKMKTSGQDVVYL